MFGFNLTPETEIKAQEVIVRMNTGYSNREEFSPFPGARVFIVRDGTPESEASKSVGAVIGVIASADGEGFLISMS